MDTGLFSFFLPFTLALMMMGLGLELSIRDFLRVIRYPKVVFIALFSQLVILVSVAFLICIALQLSPLLAVGLMLLAASPGGPTANLISYIFRGDVALNITLTALNSIIAIFSLPFIVNFSMQYFLQDSTQIAMPLEKMTQVFLVILLPVCIGMAVRSRFPKIARHLNRPMRILSVFFLCCIFFYALIKDRAHVLQYFAEVGMATSLFCFASLFIGYLIPHLAGIPERQARACTFEVGIHNTAISLTIALSVLGSTTIAVPSAIYSIFMYGFAFAFGFILTRRNTRAVKSVSP